MISQYTTLYIKIRYVRLRNSEVLLYITMLRQTRHLLTASSESSDDDANDAQPKKRKGTLSHMSSEEMKFNKQRAEIGSVVSAIESMFGNKAACQSCFSLLEHLVRVLTGALSDHLPQIIPCIFS